MATNTAPVRLPPERLAEAATVMARAVVDDPLLVHLLPDAERRAVGVLPMMDMFLRIGLAHGEVWVTTPPIAGVACWLSPTHPSVSEGDREAAGWKEVAAAWGSEAVARYRAVMADMGVAVGSLEPEPHWRLAWLGVEPGQQGQGIGSALVRQMTTRADADGVACWLFTFSPRNVPIYERLAFRVTRDTVLPSSGLRLWVMARPPLDQS